jgi:hypothetical protein
VSERWGKEREGGGEGGREGEEEYRNMLLCGMHTWVKIE